MSRVKLGRGFDNQARLGMKRAFGYRQSLTRCSCLYLCAYMCMSPFRRLYVNHLALVAANDI